MFSLALALLSFSFFAVAHVAFSHLVDQARRERVLVRFMAGSAFAFVGIDLAAAALHVASSTLSPLLDGIVGLAALGFLALGYVEFWSLIERSFSLRILIDLADADRALGLDDIARNYSGGRGLKWMMDKRTTDLIGSGTLRLDTRRGYRLSIRGRFVALAFCALHRAFCIRIE